MTNFRNIIVPETLKCLEINDPTVLDILANFQEILSSCDSSIDDMIQTAQSAVFEKDNVRKLDVQYHSIPNCTISTILWCTIQYPTILCHTTMYIIQYQNMPPPYHTIPCLLCHSIYHKMPCYTPTISYPTIMDHTLRCLPYYTITCPTMLYHTTPYTIQWHNIPHYTVPYHAIRYHTIPCTCYIMPHHTIPFHISIL